MNNQPKLYANSKVLKDYLEKLYPGVEVILTEPLPTQPPTEDKS